jgi:hypothetical protein
MTVEFLDISDHSITLWTFVVTLLGVLAALVGLYFTWRAVKDAAIQAKRNADSTRASFGLQLRQSFDAHIEAHTKLRPGGVWHGSLTEPSTEAYAKIEVYMGLFEFCDELLEQKFLKLDTFRRQYLYRVNNLLTNRFVAHDKLVCRRDGWLGFINLCYRIGVENIPDGVSPLSCAEKKSLYQDR